MSVRLSNRTGRSLVRSVFHASRRRPSRGGPSWSRAWRGRSRRRRSGRGRSGFAAERLEQRLPLSANAPPTATITLLPPADGQAGDTVRWSVAFSEAVTGVDRGDFQLAAAGGVTTASAQVSVAGSGAAYTVTATGLRGAGTVGLNLVDDGSIRDASNTPLRRTATTASFAGQTTITVGTSSSSFTESLKSADVNGDGILDLVVANNGSRSLSLLLGRGDGSFNAASIVASNIPINAIEVADLDGDRDVDLVVAGGDKKVRVLVNQGSGRFASPVAYGTDWTPESIEVADFDGDGKVDIAAACTTWAASGFGTIRSRQSQEFVSMFRGNGDATFQAEFRWALSHQVHSLLGADFSGEGRPDLIVSGSSDLTQVSNIGAGAAIWAFFRSGRPTTMAAGDVDGDLDQDLVVLDADANRLFILPGNGAGGFPASKRSVPIGDQVAAVALADVTGDGRLDIVASLPTKSQVAVLVGNGDGTFNPPSRLTVGAGPGSIAIGDFNRDGRPDIAVTNWPTTGASSVSVLRNTAKGSVTGPVAAVSVTAPPAPTNLGVNRGDRQVTLTWDAPAATGGTALTGYIVGRSDDGGATWSSVPVSLAAGRQFVFTGLSNGASYQFRVAAVNALGTGTFALSQAVRPVGFASAPRSIGGTAGDASVNLTWTAPADTGGEITTYVVEYRAASGTGSGSWTVVPRLPSALPSAAVTGLVNGREYLFRVAAVNSQGQGEYATTITPLVPRTTPGAITGLAAVAGDRVIDISWTPLQVGANGGSPLTEYVVEYKTTAAATWTLAPVVAATSATVRVASLTNGVSYVYRVAAKNAIGTGAFVDGPSAAVPFEPASAPTIQSATAGTGQVTLSWSLPASDGGREISDYAIQYRPATAQAWVPVSRTPSPDRAAVVDGLVIGTTYQFRVAAVTAAGTGAWSVTATATPFSVPTMSGLSANEIDSAVELAWLPARPNGRPVTQYVIEYRPSDPANGAWLPAGTPAEGASMSGGLNTFTVRGLVNGTRYQFRGAAVNEAGRSEFVVSDTVMPNLRPLAPTGLTATPLNRAVTLSWTPPAPNGSTAVTRYMITYRPVGAAQWTTFDSAPITTTSATVDRLVNGLNYEFEVAAVNARGVGAFARLATPVAPVAIPAPRVLGITVQGTPAFDATEVSWDVTFNTPVTGVDATDFAAVTAGFTQAGSLSVTGSGVAYVVKATGITGAGTVGLNLVDNGSIRDASGFRLSRSGETVFQETLAAMGSVPMGLAVADLNRDGRPDLVTANDGNGTASVRLALSNGSYGTVANYKTSPAFASASGVMSRAVAVADLNLDGLADIVVANRGSNTVSVLRGSSPLGTFSLQQELFAGSTPSAVALGDFNRDGRPDIVVANAMAGTVSLFASTASGGFLTRQTVAAGTAPAALAVGDVNQDGWLDIVVSSTNGSPVTLLLGSSNLTFQAARTVAAGVAPEGLAVADVNVDGKLDIVVANRTAATVSVITGNGNGSFNAPVAYPVDPNPGVVTVADIDGDARPDLVVASPFGQAASVLLADGSGGFLAKRTLTAGGFPLAVATADFNGDGRTDLAVLDMFAQGVKLFTNGLNGTTTGGVAALAPLPAAPTLASATGGNGSATLAWTAGSDGGVPITNYVVQRRSGGGEWTDVTRPVSAATTAVITGLINGTAYEFRVAAVTAIGRSGFSTASAVTPAPVAPGMIWSRSAVAGNGQATVSWAAPADDGGSPIINYILQSRSGAGDWTTIVRDTSTATSALFTGLANGTTYTFRIAAVNAVGAGDFSTPVSVTPYTLPDALSSAPVATSGNASALLTWGAPLFDGGATITNYRIERSTDGGQNWTPVSRAASSATGFIVTGLTNGTSYLFRVAPENYAGVGPFTVATAAVVPAPVAPAAPTSFVVTAGVERVTATWAAPPTDGGSPVTAYTIQYSIDAGATWATAPNVAATARNATVAGLVSGRSYIFRVAAVNAIGTGDFATAAAVTPENEAFPFVTAISLASPVGPGATSVTWNVTFSEPVTGVDAADFQLAKVGSANASSSLTVGGSGAAYTVTATGVTGTGTLGLNLVDNDSIRDSSGKRLMNRGTPVFQAGQSITARGIFVTGDFDRDGLMDAVVAQWGAAQFMRGNGDGTFQTAVGIGQDGLFQGAQSLRVADVNGDGKLDLIFAYYEVGTSIAGNTVVILPGNGNGTFGTAQSVTVGYYPFDILLTDLNADGRLDLVVANAGGDDGVRPNSGFAGSSDTVSVRLNNGSGGFAPETKLLLPANAFSLYGYPKEGQLVAGDFNRDGTVDLIAGGYLFKRNADGSFQAREVVAGGQQYQIVGVDDLDGDGWLDLVTDNGGSLWVISGSAAGFGAPVLLDYGDSWLSARLVDFDGDGKRDVVAGRQFWRGLGGGTFADPQSLGLVPSALALADLNGDGRLDILAETGWAYDGDAAAYVAGVQLNVTKGPFTGERAILTAAPGVPRSLTAARGDASANLSWTAPETTGSSAITSYAIEQSTDGGATWTASTVTRDSATATAVTVTGLRNSRTYVFRVAAVNGAGIGAFTGVSIPVLVATVPSPPTFRAWVPGAYSDPPVVAGNASASMVWNLPSSTGGARITDFEIQYSSDNGANWQTWSHAPSPLYSATVTGLQNGRTYVFRVAAINAIGRSEFSAASMAVTPITTPDAPGGMVAAASTGRAVVSWTPPAANGGSAITGYRLQRRVGGGSTWATIATLGAGQSSYTDAGLTAGTTYRYRVAAMNAAGVSAFAESADAVPGIDPVVTGIELVGSSSTAASQIAWTVTFSKPVTGVDAGDFTVAGSGVTAAALQVAGSGASYTVTAMGLVGTGTIGLNLVDDGSIRDLSGAGLRSSTGGVAYAAPQTYATGTGPQSLVRADFNGDGIGDLAFGNTTSKTVGVMLGNADGTFRPQVTYTIVQTGYSYVYTPYSLSVGDLNGDGFLDLAIGTSDTWWAVLSGQGDGTFGTPRFYFSGGYFTYASGVTVADVTGDGRPDMLFREGGNSSIRMARSNASGGFNSTELVRTFSGGVTSFIVVDVNADGRLDIVATISFNKIAVLLGTGNGSFAAPTEITATGALSGLSAADFNGDGRLDLVTNASSAVLVLLGNGNGTFQTAQSYAAGASPTATVGDVNGDGRVDIVVTNGSGSTMGVLAGRGDGTFQAIQSWSVGSVLSSPLVADVDGDGIPDLITLSSSGNTVVVQVGVRVGSFTGKVATRTNP